MASVRFSGEADIEDDDEDDGGQSSQAATWVTPGHAGKPAEFTSGPSVHVQSPEDSLAVLEVTSGEHPLSSTSNVSSKSPPEGRNVRFVGCHSHDSHKVSFGHHKKSTTSEAPEGA